MARNARKQTRSYVVLCVLAFGVVVILGSVAGKDLASETHCHGAGDGFSSRPSECRVNTAAFSSSEETRTTDLLSQQHKDYAQDRGIVDLDVTISGVGTRDDAASLRKEAKVHDSSGFNRECELSFRNVLAVDLLDAARVIVLTESGTLIHVSPFSSEGYSQAVTLSSNVRAFCLNKREMSVLFVSTADQLNAVRWYGDIRISEHLERDFPAELISASIATGHIVAVCGNQFVDLWQGSKKTYDIQTTTGEETAKGLVILAPFRQSYLQLQGGHLKQIAPGTQGEVSLHRPLQLKTTIQTVKTASDADINLVGFSSGFVQVMDSFGNPVAHMTAPMSLPYRSPPLRCACLSEDGRVAAASWTNGSVTALDVGSRDCSHFNLAACLFRTGQIDLDEYAVLSASGFTDMALDQSAKLCLFYHRAVGFALWDWESNDVLFAALPSQ